MSSQNKTDTTSASQGDGSLASYTTGFILSIVLTLVAYFMVVDHWLSSWSLVIALLGLAVVQFCVQMVLFLHISSEKKPRNRQLVMWMMIVIVLVVVIGSVWIIYNLNDRMNMSIEQMKSYMTNQQSL